MVRLQILLGFTAAMISLISCTPERSAMSDGDQISELENVHWKLTELDGAALAPTPRGVPSIKLSSKEKRAHGFAGCNRFFAGYELNGEKLRFTGLASTRMACIEPTPEAALLKALAETASWKLDGHVLELFDAAPSLRSRWTVLLIESGSEP